MKILIFYASYGGGHFNAAKSLCQYIQDTYTKENVEVEMIDAVKYVNKAIEKVTATTYRIVSENIPWVWGRFYEDSQKRIFTHLTSRSNVMLALKLAKLLNQKKPDIVISTHPLGSQMCSYLKRKNKVNFKLATILTDFESHDQWLIGHEDGDCFFVSHNKMKERLVSKGVLEKKIFVTGIPVSNRFLQDYDKAKILSEYSFTPDKKTLLFFGRGSDGLLKSHLTETFKSFVANCSSMQIIAVTGNNNEDTKSKFEEVVRDYNAFDRVKVLGFSNQIPELMHISDLVVTKPGGLTVTESLVSHLPLILINPFPGQEEENARILELTGSAIWIRKSDDVDDIISLLMSGQINLDSMRENAIKFAKPNSCRDICDILLK